MKLPLHLISLENYWIGKYPVTNEEYWYFIREAKHRTPSVWEEGKFPAGRERYPVTHVNWYDAIAYCRWLSEISGRYYLLPSEAEWEKSIRGTSNSILGDTNGKKDTVILKKLGIEAHTAVGTFSPQGDSPYGCAEQDGQPPNDKKFVG